jgi:hypothetical protein
MLTRTLVVCLLVGTAGSAHAYCRTHTRDSPPSTCPDSCQQLGVPLAWGTPNLHYTFNERGFPDLDDDALRRLFAQAAEPWTSVTCDGEPIGLDLVARAETTDLTVGPELGPRREPNENAIAYLSPEEWNAEKLGNKAYATTAVWYDTNTGELLGADMLFNATMGPFGECAESGCTSPGPRVDLRNVATHEFGHFLGLAHSDVEDATMYCNAPLNELSKRTLAADDLAGLCAIYPPEDAFMASTSRSSDGCALGGAASGGWVCLALLLRRRRR